VEALIRCINFALDEPPAEAIAGYKAATRLANLLPTIESNKTAIEKSLRKECAERDRPQDWIGP